MSFEQILLNQIMPDVKKHLTKETLKNTSFFKLKMFNKNHIEIHIQKCYQFPNGYFNETVAYNMADGKYKLFSQILRNLGIKEYE